MKDATVEWIDGNLFGAKNDHSIQSVYLEMRTPAEQCFSIAVFANTNQHQEHTVVGMIHNAPHTSSSYQNLNLLLWRR